MSDVDLLRRAAALMRERAEGATPGPWASMAREARIVCSDCMGTEKRHWFAGVSPEGYPSPSTWMTGPRNHDGPTARADSEHIASWHPAVALAVADWLDYVADAHDETACPAMSAAEQVARAYLGEQP